MGMGIMAAVAAGGWPVAPEGLDMTVARCSGTVVMRCGKGVVVDVVAVAVGTAGFAVAG